MGQEYLRELLQKYDEEVKKANELSIQLMELTNQINILNAKMDNVKRNIRLIQEQIMCEKKLIEIK